MAEDYYKTLGVSRDASQDEIQKAYRTLARKYHPDLHPDDKSAKENFQRVQQAFDVLNDSSKRELYDRYGSSFESMGAGGPRGGPEGGPQYRTWTSSGGFSPEEEVDLSQYFGERFGGGPGSPFGDIFGGFRRGESKGRRARGAPRRGADLAAELIVPFVTAVAGGNAQISIRRQSGEVETLTVKIPAGISDGKKIRLRGQGEAASGNGTPGDILITIHVAPHPYFTRHGNHLDVTIPVTIAEAARGAKVDVPTPKGTVSVRIPPGTSGGKKLRIRGHGVAPKGVDPGDLFVVVNIVLPPNLDEQGLELIDKLDQHTGHEYADQARREVQW